jgi:transglutaminase-like putative cysteine protease
MKNAALDLRSLAAIVVSLTLVMAPHAARVPVWTTVLCTFALALRLYVGWRRRALPGRWALLILALAGVAGVLYSYRTLFGRDSGVTLLLVMAALKMLELRRPRDVNVVIVLCYFLTITNFFYTQTIPTALYTLGAVWVVTATMVSLQHEASPGQPLHIVRTSGTMLAQAIPVMLVLFVLFPRIQGPLWGMPQLQSTARSGLSDTMSPGTIADLSLSDEIAFRAQFETVPANAQQLYWRGPVMWDYDGRTWRTGQPTALSAPRHEALSEPLAYTVTLEPHQERWLLLIDLPSRLPPRSLLTRDYQVLSFRPVRERIRYEAQSLLQYRFGDDALASELQQALQLPPGTAPRALEMARSWRAEQPDARALVERALRMFRDEPFIYTLAPPELTKDPVDEFLFETRRGFCEHFASSFTVLMRAAGVPARVVTGYLGGELNPVDGYLVVRQSEAHAWSEVWIAGSGWVRIDPTAAVSPMRIQQGLANAVPATDPLPLFRRVRADWLRTVRHTWDAVSNSWNQWVLGYSPERQTRFLSSLGFPQITWQDMVIALSVTTGALIAGFAAVMMRRLRSGQVDQVQRAWLAFCAAMAARGVSRRLSEGPRDFSRRCAQTVPVLRERIESVTRMYIRLRYGRDRGPELLAQLRAAIASIER